jgi:hypothetical protein
MYINGSNYNIIQINNFLLQYLEKKGVKDLQREHFSFSTKIYIGDFLRPSGVSQNNGEEKYVK